MTRRLPQTRTARINLLVLPHERESWHAAAARENVSLSEWIRRLAESAIRADLKQVTRGSTR